jgi:two-component sensor histidine kinase
MSARYLRGSRLKVAFLIFLLVAVPVNAAIWLFCYQEIGHKRSNIKSNALSLVEMQRIRIGTDFRLLVSDLLFFAGYNELLDSLDNGKHLLHLKEDLSLFSRGSRQYDQVRVIDNSGMESIRINLSREGVPIVVPDQELQNKGKRYYFLDTIKLGEGEVFISPLDLNIERGEVERPLKPMIRFGTPVFDRRGGKHGILIFNYLGEYMLSDFRFLSSDSAGDSMLLNSGGYWLVGREPGEEWGFMFEGGEQKTFQSSFPDAWPRILESDSGQVLNGNGLFTFTTVYPLIEGWKTSTGAGRAFEPSISMMEAREYLWKIVNHVPASYFAQATRDQIVKYIVLSSIITLVIWAGSWKLARLEKLKAALTEKNTLLREIHHRVKNNLQVLLSLNSIQTMHHRGNEAVVEMLEENQCRLKAMSLVQDRLYQEDEISRIDLKSYIEKLVFSINSLTKEAHAPVAFEVSVEDINIHVDNVVPCGMIINELVINSLKHAFSGMEGGRVEVKLRRHGKKGVALEVSDNGAGLPGDVDMEKVDTVGFMLVRSLVDQIDGRICAVRDGGTKFIITFSALDD